MAGHVQFGARTGGALVILGVALLVTATFFSGSVAMLLGLFPLAVLGVILFLTGAQLAPGACDVPKDNGVRCAVMVSDPLPAWNVGIAFVVGVAAYWLNKKVLLRVENEHIRRGRGFGAPRPETAAAGPYRAAQGPRARAPQTGLGPFGQRSHGADCDTDEHRCRSANATKTTARLTEPMNWACGVAGRGRVRRLSP